MRKLILALLPLSFLLGACTSTSYDLLETASVPPRFADKDPQDFGIKSPHRHPIHGIDVSKWNGNVDWNAVRQSGVSFVFIKATEGKDVIDPKFAEYWRGARMVGLRQAPYHFYYFCSTPDEQANWFIANVPKAALDMPPVIDVEWNHTSKTCTTRPPASVVRAQIQRFMDRLEAYYGKRPIIYTSVDFHKDNLEGAFQDHYFWVRAVAKHPSEIYKGRNWAFWQYTSTGLVPGIKGQTDINVFAGTRQTWNQWLAAVAQPSVPQAAPKEPRLPQMPPPQQQQQQWTPQAPTSEMAQSVPQPLARPSTQAVAMPTASAATAYGNNGVPTLPPATIPDNQQSINSATRWQ